MLQASIVDTRGMDICSRIVTSRSSARKNHISSGWSVISISTRFARAWSDRWSILIATPGAVMARYWGGDVINGRTGVYVLGYFGDREASAVELYREHIESMSSQGRQSELTGGGLVRSMGGWSEVKSLRQRGEKQFCDERILGSGEFVRDVLMDTEETNRERLPAMPADAAAGVRVREVCDAAGVSVDALLGGSRIKVYTELRKRLVVEFVCDKGISYAGTAKYLGVSESAVYQILKRLRSRP